MAPSSPKLHGGRGSPGSYASLSDQSARNNNPCACILARLWIQFATLLGSFPGRDYIGYLVHALSSLTSHTGHTYKWKFLDPRSNFMLETIMLAEALPSGLPISWIIWFSTRKIMLYLSCCLPALRAGVEGVLFFLVSKSQVEMYILAGHGGAYFNPSLLVVDVGRSQWIQGQPNLQHEFQASQGYIMRPRLKKKEENDIVIQLTFKTHILKLCLKTQGIVV